jgi:uncharacterized protein YifE (UPF0438 family)
VRAVKRNVDYIKRRLTRIGDRRIDNEDMLVQIAYKMRKYASYERGEIRQKTEESIEESKEVHTRGAQTAETRLHRSLVKHATGQRGEKRGPRQQENRQNF